MDVWELVARERIRDTLARYSWSGDAFRLFKWRAPETRMQIYLETLIAREDYAKEVKLYGLGPRLLGRYRAIYDKLYLEDRALTIRAAQLGEDHPEVAIALTNIANALIGAGSYAEAEQLARRALAIFEKKFGAEHPYTAASHTVIGNSLLERGRKLAWADPKAARPFRGNRLRS